MFRKSILALAAVSALGTAALIPTGADAHWGGRYGWYGTYYAPYPAFYGHRYAYGPRYVRRDWPHAGWWWQYRWR